jgi:hypothetical protein
MHLHLNIHVYTIKTKTMFNHVKLQDLPQEIRGEHALKVRMLEKSRRLLARVTELDRKLLLHVAQKMAKRQAFLSGYYY